MKWREGVSLAGIYIDKKQSNINRIKKGRLFSEAGKIARQVAFVNNGILRVCYYNNKGQEITRYFIDENNFAVDLNSFTY